MIPSTLEREIEDIEALIDKAGGSAYLYGHSSGACLALDAAVKLGDKVKKLAMYEAPYNDDPEHSRPYFRRMRELFNQISQRNLASVRMDILSMGMSHDFEVAIEEGSSCVRIGAAIFGERRKAG